jgi:energy-coupling factor transporter ATP-binding protein EcfA2
MKIRAISVSNFRSIGEEGLTLPLSKKVNVLIGQNNAGKSNLIRALQKIKSMKPGNPPTIALDQLDVHVRDGKNTFSFTIHMDPSDLLKNFGVGMERVKDPSFTYTGTGSVVAAKSFLLDLPVDLKLRIFTKWTGSRYTTRPTEDQLNQNMATISMRCLPQLMGDIPEVHLVPQFRQILPGDEYSLDGKNIIGMLRQFQHPNVGNDD